MSFDFTALLETARDLSLDDEARLLAVMTITSKIFRKRARLLEITEDRPGRPRQPSTSPPVKRQGKSKEPTIKDFLIAQLLIVDHYDQDNRPIGLRYDEIGRRLLIKFPVILRPGSRQGQPPSTDRTALHDLSFLLRKEGYVLPHRPRSANGGTSGRRKPLSQAHRAAIRAGMAARRARPVRGTMIAAEHADALHTHHCLVCGAGFTPASAGTDRGVRRPPLYCSGTCRQRAYERRQASGGRD